MKKLELKNLTVKRMSNEEKAKVKGGDLPADTGTSGCCNDNSVWPVTCTSIAWKCGL